MPLSGGDTGVITQAMAGTSWVGGATLAALFMPGDKSITGRAPSVRTQK